MFVYVTLCAHVESVLAELIRARLNSTNIIRWDAFGPFTWTDNGVAKTCALTPVLDSIRRVLAKMIDESHTAPLSKLTELYGTLFGQKLRDKVGSKLADDLEAIAALRNLFAHGRDLSWEFSDNFMKEIDMDSSAIKKAFVQLLHAKIIPNLNVTGANHDEFQDALFSDASVEYFYSSVRNLHEDLLKGADFPPESYIHSLELRKLPKLDF